MNATDEALRRHLALDPTCSLNSLYLSFGHSEKARVRQF